MSKHTPGPWFVHHDSVFATGDFDGWNEKTICHTSFERDGDTPANMALIAAAPELLEALEYLVENCLESEGGSYERAVGAIKKARGS
jgi:hypothetical protein